MNELEKLKHYFESNLDFYRCYRTQSNYLEHKYFLRGKYDIRLTVDSFYSEGDKRFSASHDFKVAKILAHYRLQVSGGGGFSSHIFITGGLPFYSSFSCVPYKNKLVFYFNDNDKNIAVTKTSQAVKTAYNFRKSSCYTLTLDLETGNVTRRMLFTNTDEPVAMVRHGMLTGNELYLIAFRNSMLGKSSIKLGKVTVK